MKPTYVGVDVIMQGFDTFIKKCPYFSLWNGKVLLGQWNEEDNEAAREWFEQTIQAYEASRNTDTITVKFHPELTGGYITNATPVMAAMLIKCYDPASLGYAGNDESRIPHTAYKSMMDRLTSLLDERLGKAGEDEPEPTQMEVIAGFLERPGIAPLAQQIVPMLKPLIDKITNLVASFVPGQAPTGQTNTDTGNLAINGTPLEAPKQEPLNTDNMTDEQKLEVIQTSLDRMAGHVDVIAVLPKLADYMDNNPSMIPMLLTFIKA